MTETNCTCLLVKQLQGPIPCPCRGSRKRVYRGLLCKAKYGRALGESYPLAVAMLKGLPRILKCLDNRALVKLGGLIIHQVEKRDYRNHKRQAQNHNQSLVKHNDLTFCKAGFLPMQTKQNTKTAGTYTSMSAIRTVKIRNDQNVHCLVP